LRIIAQKSVTWALQQAQKFYAEHKGRPFYDDVCTFMTLGPIVVLKGEEAIAKCRKVMGATEPAEAKKGTIRKRFARTMAQNSVHGSDRATSATREIALNSAGRDCRVARSQGFAANLMC
jgi:nucleoside-diphosphate kinase